MKWVYKTLRAILVVCLVLAIVVPAGLYVALSFRGVQNAVRERAETELTSLLGMDVSIGDVYMAPFSRLTLRHVAITDSLGDTAVSIDRLGAGVSIPRLIFRRRMVVTYTEIIGLDAQLRRDSVGAPLNIQPMINALAPKHDGKPPRQFDFRVNTVVVRKSALSYDVGCAAPDSAKFDPDHIRISDLRADLRLPKIANNDFRIDLQRLALSERSGLTVSGLDGSFHISDTMTTVKGLSLSLPASRLAFADMEASYPSLSRLGECAADIPIAVRLLDDSRITPADFAAFEPRLARLTSPFDIALDLRGTMRSLEVENIDVSGLDGEVWLRGSGVIAGLADGRNSVSVDLPRIGLGCYGSGLVNLLGSLSVPLDSRAETILGNVGHVDLLGEVKGAADGGHLSATLLTDAGTLTAGLSFGRAGEGKYKLEYSADFDNIDGAALFAGISGAVHHIGAVTAGISGEGVVDRGIFAGNADIDVSHVEFRGYAYENIIASAAVDGHDVEVRLAADNPGLAGEVTAHACIGGADRCLDAVFDIKDLAPGRFGAGGRLGDSSLSAAGDIDLRGTSADDFTGKAVVTTLKLSNADGLMSDFGRIEIVADEDSLLRSITLRSDFLDVTARGAFKASQLVASARTLIASALPQLVTAGNAPVAAGDDSLTVEARIKTTKPFEPLVNLPVKVIYPVSLTASYTAAEPNMRLTLDAPYLQQGNRLLESMALTLSLHADSVSDPAPRGNIYITTLYPTKKGDMTLTANTYIADGRVDSKFSWKVARERNFSGDIDLSASFERDSLTAGAVATHIDINPSRLVFNDTVWNVEPARIDILPQRITVSDFRVGRKGQFITAHGVASPEESDSMLISLRNVNLDYVFETLDIPTAMFGGVASGDFHASAALSKMPVLFTDNLDVKALSYNHSLMGDTHVESYWDVPSKAVVIDALVSQPNGGQSKIDGRIMPLSDSLDFFFDADRIEVGFMKPFMEAFTSQVSGYASGKARLWGSFKYIDMVGDIYAEDLKLKLDFTNTVYTATDSVHLTPGHIDLDNITLRDIYGNTAKLNGWLDHEYFKQPKFNFRISDARNMLVYDVKENTETNWFGRIFGNGSATVTGQPGIVNIGVNMSTAPNSTFTFVLSDTENANDYTFITFRDRDRARKDSIAAATAPPVIVQELKKKIAGSSDSGPGSIYDMNINIAVNPGAQINLVMDPVGGDRIRAYGNGNLRMAYDSSSEDLRMYGTYTLQRGSYNFTLQDIIIKDFTIRDGSSISFTGDPYAAQLNIEAVYSLNANLSDLDESFLEDRELSRTNVPVHALLKVSGDMRQPDIGFDLEFPTLTQDTYRKVRSIVSTEDMMNRQIIYLLALNRFYTPDYMNATKGNEFVSVASSTISSQLSNILGQLSDNWTLAPNFRSDRGDFSDVEVDLALSSHLLNNRLLLNGNFGYRDKALNNNSFIGDFDIEYLLNRSGNMRLKAYNRYNDRNFYVKSALTTQGVGVVFKRDFDNIFSFLRRKKKKADKPAESGDTSAQTPEIIITSPVTSDTVITIKPEVEERPADDFIIFRKK
ncbi:MAG: translocation/assembly module TamB [Paramuribaculum sp.]|nr:translocation/assembly module TamB [Paramuribaculum sp.]